MPGPLSAGGRRRLDDAFSIAPVGRVAGRDRGCGRRARAGGTPISADVEIPASFFLPPGGDGTTAVASAAAPPSFAAITLARLRGLWSRVARIFTDPALPAAIGLRNAWAQATPRGAT